MIILRSPFLIGGRRIAVEQMCPAVPLAVKFNPGRVGKFTAVISKDNREEIQKGIRSQFQVKPVKDINDRLGVIGIPEECQHQRGVDEVDGKEDFSPFDAFNGINLYNRGIRMVLQIAAIIFPGTSDAAGLIDFEADRF